MADHWLHSTSFWPPILHAPAYTGLGETERALDLIGRRWLITFGGINLNPIFDPLRKYPRFQAWSELYVIQ